MNKKLVTVTIGVALSLPFVAVQAANSGPTVYGKLFAGYQLSDNGVVDQYEMQTNSSRFGFKGTADLSNGLEGIYQIERGIDITGEDTTISARPTYVGLKGSFGTITAGVQDTPFKMSQGKADMFNDVEAELSGVRDLDLKDVLTSGEIRMTNSIAYLSPKFSGMEFRLQVAPGERSDTTVVTAASEADGPLDQASLSLVYEQNGFYGAIAYDSEVQSTQGTTIPASGATFLTGRDAVRLTGGATMGAFSGYVMLEQSELANVAGADSETGFLVSGSYAIGQTTLKAQVISSDIRAAGGQQVSLGVDQALAKKTRAMAFFSTYKNDADAESDVFGVGVEHSF